MTDEGIALALELPLMAGIATPRRAKRSMEITMVKRKEEWDRRMRARDTLEARGLFDWVGGFFDGSRNCYVDGYPAFSKQCAVTSSPYIRTPVCPFESFLTIDWTEHSGICIYHHAQESRFKSVLQMAEEHGYCRHANSFFIQLSQGRHRFQRRWITRHVKRCWCF
jgi:hypothetical protein